MLDRFFKQNNERKPLIDQKELQLKASEELRLTALKFFIDFFSKNENLSLGDDTILNLLKLSFTCKALNDLINANNPNSPFYTMSSRELLVRSIRLLEPVEATVSAKNKALESARYQSFNRKSNITVYSSAFLLFALEVAAFITLAIFKKMVFDPNSYESSYTTTFIDGSIDRKRKLTSQEIEDRKEAYIAGQQLLLTPFAIIFAAFITMTSALLINRAIKNKFLNKLSNEIRLNYISREDLDQVKNALNALQRQHPDALQNIHKNDCLTLFANAKYLNEKQKKQNETLAAQPQSRV